METIMANIWGEQQEVTLASWDEIKTLGFEKRDRAFGTLNDGTNALFFGRTFPEGWKWYVTTDKEAYPEGHFSTV